MPKIKRNVLIIMVIVASILLSWGIVKSSSNEQSPYAMGLKFAMNGDFVRAKEHFNMISDAADRNGVIHKSQLLKTANDVINSAINKEAATYAFTGAFYVKKAFGYKFNNFELRNIISPEIKNYVPPRKKVILDKAGDEFNKAIALDPNIALAHFGLGWVYSLYGKHDEAMAEYRTAERLDPNEWTTHNAIVWEKKS